MCGGLQSGLASTEVHVTATPETPEMVNASSQTDTVVGGLFLNFSLSVALSVSLSVSAGLMGIFNPRERERHTDTQTHRHTDTHRERH